MAGTIWCGKGSRANSILDLGAFSSADRCCRQHDLGCPTTIPAGEERFGLVNDRFTQVMHCSCDQRFRSCLKMARTFISESVGNIYFNLVDVPCFVFIEQKKCVSVNWWGRCVLYETRKMAEWKNLVWI
eukprot:TRINITY_DN41985_c0_g1_i1.p1 TRINITY_DN41985_c0_g1~~TRINITY_DN41985_c0_g1_i1.p1  ORF type:complete len:129 (-),score=29.30 TRINITY_DN41985_c0_g1_i1:135-521(-)